MTRNIATAPDHGVRGKVHEYWIERRRIREARRGAASRKPQAHKQLDNPVDLWDKVI